MTTPGRLHFAATIGLILCLGAVTMAEAGVFGTPSGGWGVIDHPAPAPRPDGFGTTVSGDPNL